MSSFPRKSVTFVVALAALTGACLRAPESREKTVVAEWAPPAAEKSLTARPADAVVETTPPVEEAPATPPTPEPVADVAPHVPGSAQRLDTGVDLSALRLTPPPPPPPPPASRGNLEEVNGASTADLGVMVQGEVAQHTFVLENRGEEPVVLHAANHSCGCTVSRVLRVGEGDERRPYLYGEPIEVGERIELVATVDSEGKRNLLETMVTLQTSAAQPTYLRLTARVEPFLVVTPEGYLVVPAMRADETRTTEFRVRTAGEQPFGLTVDETNLPRHARIELTPVDPDENGRAAVWDGRLVVGPDVPEGIQQHLGIVLVSDAPTVSRSGAVDHSRTHRAYLYAVLQEVVGIVRVQPTALTFGIVRPGLTVSRPVRIEVADETFRFPAEPAVRIAEGGIAGFDASEHFHTKVEVAEDGRSAEFMFTLSDLPESFEGLIHGSVEIEVGHASKQTVSVPFTAVCRPQIQGPAPR